MKIARYTTIVLTAIILAAMFSSAYGDKPLWGFYGHKKINRIAVFALPQNMIGFYKKNIEYITEHAVDPDKRRYATKHEGVRHYIDIDHWGKIPFPEVPRKLDLAVIKYGQMQLIEDADTSNLDLTYDIGVDTIVNINKGKQIWYSTSVDQFESFFREKFFSQYYEDEWIVSGAEFDEYFDASLFENNNAQLRFVDRFSHQGILPYHLEMMFFQLIKAFRQEDVPKILRLSADYGHYIADAHVPLHTTTNYNGQLTDQVGIHAFWESRLPELFAEKDYDFFVGTADFIEKPRDYFWNIVIESHSLVDSVLSIEKRLSKSFPQDRQYCYDERLNRTVRIECQEYAEAYNAAMGDMVENRMRDAIRAISSIWYTAWARAGQPEINTWADEDYETVKEAKKHSILSGGSHDERL